MENKLYHNILYLLNNYQTTLDERKLLTHTRNMLESGQDFDSAVNTLKNGLSKQNDLSPKVSDLADYLNHAA